jgi:hypothetical protein
MSSSIRLSAVAGCALLAIGLPSAAAEPSTDSQGYLDSTARCSPPTAVVVFGATATSRVAICKSAEGQLEYRGVRVSDGAKLIVAAKQSGDATFVAENDGFTYTVTSNFLVVSVGSRVIREEPMVDFHGPLAPNAPTGTATPAPPKPTSTTPLPPPLPAEVGGAGR